MKFSDLLDKISSETDFPKPEIREILNSAFGIFEDFIENFDEDVIVTPNFKLKRKNIPESDSSSEVKKAILVLILAIAFLMKKQFWQRIGCCVMKVFL